MGASTTVTTTGTCDTSNSCTLTGTVLPGTNPLKAPAPDLTAVWYMPQPWGHLHFGAVLRPALQFKDGLFVNRRYVGYGFHLSGDVKPGWFDWTKDDFIAGFTWGDAIGRYITGGSTFALVSNYPANAPPSTRAAAAGVLVKRTAQWGAIAGYQHWWRNNLRSNISAGVSHNDFRAELLSTSLLTSLNKEVMSAHINLIWSPVPFIDIGIEYMWAHRVVAANLRGDERAIVSNMIIRF